MPRRTRKLAITEGISAGIFFGTASIFIRFLQNLDSFAIAFWRLVIACLALAIVLLVSRKLSNLNLVRKNLRGILILGFFLGLHFVFFISAVKDTTILNATVFVNTVPLFSMFISSFFLKLKPSRLALVGLVVSFVGISVIAYAETMVSDTNVRPRSVPSSLKGDLEAMLAALLSALYLNSGRKMRNQMTLLSTMFSVYLFAAVIVGVLGIFIVKGNYTFPIEAEFIIPLLGLGILPTAIAHTLYFSSLSNLKSFETATMALLEPVGATLLALVVFLEKPAFVFVFGAALILLGIFFVLKEE